jgi:hypothetical protein
MLIAAFVRWPIVVYLALMMAGASWMAVMSTFNTATQTSAPPWVRARAVALHVLARSARSRSAPRCGARSQACSG